MSPLYVLPAEKGASHHQGSHLLALCQNAGGVVPICVVKGRQNP